MFPTFGSFVCFAGARSLLEEMASDIEAVQAKEVAPQETRQKSAATAELQVTREHSAAR